MIHKGEIKDGKTIAALFAWQARKKRIIKTDEPYLVSGGWHEKAETKDRQTAATNYRHCLPFFFIGDGRRRASWRIFCRRGSRGSFLHFLQQALADGDEIGFAAIFWKYLKYDIIIWLGGWMQLGLFFAGRRSCFGASVSASPLP